MKKLANNPGKRPLNEHEPIPNGPPIAPKSMSKPAAIKWRRLVGSMPPELWTSCDETLLLAYVENAVLLDLAIVHLHKDGAIIKDANGNEQLNKWHKVFTEASSKVQTLGARLGLDPVSRQAIKLPDQADIGLFGVGATTKQ